MAFPSIAATATTNGSTAATNKTCNLPSDIQAGDLLLLWLRSGGSDTHTTPSGWQSLVLNNGSDASDDVTSLFYRVADGTEGSTVVVTATTSRKFAALAWRIAGADTSVAPVAAVAIGTSNAPNPPSLSPSWGTADCLWLAVYGIEGTSTVSAWPANYTLSQITIATSGGTATTNTRVAGAGRQLTAATEDPGAFTASASEDWTAATIAIRGLDLTPVSDSESGLSLVAEAESPEAQITSPDTVTPAIVESELADSDSSDGDALSAAIADTEQVAADYSASDTVSSTLAESAVVEAVTEIGSSDTIDATVTDIGAAAANIADTDAPAAPAEAELLAADAAAADALAASVTDQAAADGDVVSAETLPTLVAESEAAEAAASSVDDLSASVADAVSLAAAVDVSDTGVSIVESELVEQAGYVVTDSDTLSPALTESVTVDGSITIVDAMGVASDVEAVLADTAATDTISLTLSDMEAVAGVIGDDDVGTVLAAMEALAAVIQAIDPLSAGIREAVERMVDRGPWIVPRNRHAVTHTARTQAKTVGDVKFTVEGPNVFRPKRS